MMRKFQSLRPVAEIGIAVLVTIVILAPQTHLRLGNLFFGDVPSLYNVDFAHVFFSYAAYTPIAPAPEFAHYQLSRTIFIRGQLERSLTEAQEELRLHPQNTRTYYILGLTYGYLNKEQEAIAAFSSFLEAYPQSWAARNDMAWLQFRIGDIEGAAATIEPVAWIHNPWIQNTYGIIKLNQGEFEVAKLAFLQAQEIVLNMTEEEWGQAYPGNNPSIYGVGLRAMSQSIAANLAIIAEKQEMHPQLLD